MLINYRFLEGRRTAASSFEAFAIAYQEDDGPVTIFTQEMSKPYFPPGPLELLGVEVVKGYEGFHILRWTEVQIIVVPPAEEKDWDSAWLLMDRMEWWRRQSPDSSLEDRLKKYIDDRFEILKKEVSIHGLAS